jgi:peptidoglycan/xylan/chitin deacetylase (PgdA/CDA1 family)
MTLIKVKRLLKKMALAAGLDALVIRRSDAAIILCLHHVAEPDDSMLSQRVAPITPDVFAETLYYLQSRGYAFVSLSEIVNGADYSKKAAITFDDGFRSIYTHAFPILRKFQSPFTVFLTTSMLGADRLLWQHRLYAAADRLAPADIYRIMARCSLQVQPHTSLKNILGDLVRQTPPEQLLVFTDELAAAAGLTAADEAQLAELLYLKPAEVKEMITDGMTIGAHGHQHWSMTTLNPSQTESEVARCQEQIQNTFGVQAAHYALPYGRSNRHISSVVQQLNFKSLCTTEPGLVWTNTDHYALPRLMVGTHVFDLAGQITLLHWRRLIAGRQSKSPAR